jgi:hypothetical protein
VRNKLSITLRNNRLRLGLVEDGVQQGAIHGQEDLGVMHFVFRHPPHFK